MTNQDKEHKLFGNLLRTTEEFMRGKNFVPLTRIELMQKLHLPAEHKEVFKKVLSELAKKGVTKFQKGRYHPKKSTKEILSGELKLHPRGFGFVTPEDPSLFSQDIFIPKQFTLNAVDGDQVEVEINPLNFSSKGPEGKITAILKRGRTHLAGTICTIEWHGNIIAYAPLLGREQRVVVQPSPDLEIRVGDRVIMEVISWGDARHDTQCRITHLLGHVMDPSSDISSAIEEYELRSDFPRPVIREARSFGNKVSLKDLQNREDLRHLECVTIDPDTAKDFDDAINVSKDSEGNYSLGVHIADVSHYVRTDSHLDKEAKLRANSTYFPGHCIPMLPGELSENLCSLRPNVNRLAVSVLMQFDPKGNLIRHDIVRSVIKSRKRFTYKEAKLVLDNQKKSPHAAHLKEMVALCQVLKNKRYERGSIEFSLPELAIIVDEQGAPVRTEYIPYDITHQLVEEFMLKANEVVAQHLSAKGKDLSYRIHEEPSEQNMKDFVALAQAFGYSLPEIPSPQDLQQLFDEALNSPYGPFLATSYIRRMRLALYSPENIGHYGLGLTHYCHFTSPIRRYVDLVIHRILFGNELAFKHLQEISQHCSEQERIAERAENSVTLLKKLRLLDKITQDNPHAQFEAVVTRVRNFGIYFEVSDFMLEGFLHLSQLEDDFYEFDEKSVTLRGIYGGATFFAGDKLTVMLNEIDFIFLETKWHHVSGNKGGKRRHKQDRHRTKRKKRR